MVPIAWVAAILSFTLALGLWKSGRGRGDVGKPRTPGGDKEKENVYLITSKFERMGWSRRNVLIHFQTDSVRTELRRS